MRRFILHLWRRIKPWVERAEHADLLVGKTGIGEFLWKWIYPVVAIVSATVGWLWAWWDQALGYQRFLAALLAVALFLLIVRLVIWISDKLAAPRALHDAAPRANNPPSESDIPVGIIASTALTSLPTLRRHYEEEGRRRLSEVMYDLHQFLNNRVSPPQLEVHKITSGFPYRIPNEGAQFIIDELSNIRASYSAVRSELIERFLQGHHYYADEIQDITANKDQLSAELAAIDDYTAALKAVPSVPMEGFIKMLTPYQETLRHANFELGSWVSDCNQRINAKRNALKQL